MTEFWNSWWAFACMLAHFVISLSGVAIGVYIACSRHLDNMLLALPNSSWPKHQRNILGTASLGSRCYLVSTIGGALFFSKFNVRKGVLDAEDVRNFPPPLRRLLVGTTWLVFIGMGWLGVMIGLLKLTGK